MTMYFTREEALSVREGAPFHVQLELKKGSGEFSKRLRLVRVEGCVVRVFRSDGRLAPGDHVAFKLWVCRRGDEPTGPAYVYQEDFIRATHMEAYLHGTPPDCELAGYEFTIITAPSDEPSMNVGQLEGLFAGFEKQDEPSMNVGQLEGLLPGFEMRRLGTPKPRRWWHFWKT
jgi:hypothetical protein